VSGLQFTTRGRGLPANARRSVRVTGCRPP
jgi:hypothetical protein